MFGSRGKGKVVPRQTKQLAHSGWSGHSSSDAAAAAAQAVPDGNSAVFEENGVSSSRTALQQQAMPALPQISMPNNSSGSDPAPQPFHEPGPAMSIVSVPSLSTDLQRRYVPYLDGGAPMELSSQLMGTAKSREVLAQQQPVRLRGLHLARCKLTSLTAEAERPQEAASAITPQHLQQQQQQQHNKQPLSVLCSSCDTNRFMAADMTKNPPGSYYHLRKPETTVLAMSFTEWLAAWQTWDKNRLLLQVDVCTWELLPPFATGGSTPASPRLRLWPYTAVCQHLPQLLDTQPTSTQSTAANTTAAAATPASNSPAALIDWSKLQQLLQDGQYQPQGQLQLLAGGRDALMPAQYYTHDRLICQVSGHQRLLLIPPEHCFSGCYPYPVAHPYDRYSCVDWEEPELQHWPAAAHVKGVVCELSPGDSLLVPAYWFLHSQLQQPACVSLVLQLHPLRTKLLRSAALLVQLSRMVEVWTAAEVGVPNVRKWLLALSEGCEWQRILKQVQTVQGYKLVQLCHLILQQMQQVLSLKPMPLPASLISNTSTAKSAPPQHKCTSSMPADATGACSSDTRGPSTQEVKGSLQCCHAIACSSAVECQARRTLGDMCEERLLPTHWLNQGIADPLYLKHQPEYYLIEEDAEAAKYPGLFRHRLISERPDWQQHAQPLQLAPAGSGKTLIKSGEQGAKLLGC